MEKGLITWHHEALRKLCTRFSSTLSFLGRSTVPFRWSGPVARATIC